MISAPKKKKITVPPAWMDKQYEKRRPRYPEQMFTDIRDGTVDIGQFLDWLENYGELAYNECLTNNQIPV